MPGAGVDTDLHIVRRDALVVGEVVRTVKVKFVEIVPDPGETWPFSTVMEWPAPRLHVRANTGTAMNVIEANIDAASTMALVRLIRLRCPRVVKTLSSIVAGT